MTDAPVFAPADEAPDSLQALLRTKRKRQAMQRRRVFELPGYDGLVGVKMRAADAHGMFADQSAGLDDGDITEANVESVMRSRREMIARSCVEIMVRHASVGAWKPLAEELGDGLGVVRFDERFAGFLGAEPGEVTSAEEVVGFALSYDFNLASLYMEFLGWVGNESPLEDDELVGESSAAN